MTKEIPCKKCGKLMKFEVDDSAASMMRNLDEFIANSYCALCLKEKLEDEEEVINDDYCRERQAAWAAMCNGKEEYLNTDIAMLPDLQSFQQAMNWKYGSTGLLLRGPTRRGKTRSAFKVLEREYMNGHSIKLFGPKEFTRECGMAAQESLKTAKRFVKYVSNVDILFLDDFGKADMSDSAQASIFEVIENRCAGRKPIVITTNDLGETLENRFYAERGAPLIARLREYCQQVVFRVK